ncbi:MAG TPA: 4Fe-4S binding protein [Nitrosopumilaceae archaeon]|jgi:NAD-dependent dihydropyrimidine dehydrogenase PreA subunit/transcription termination factor NusB|nr:4Fe-4S binding protein [Nitrosopumilaceae archaeon]
MSVLLKDRVWSMEASTAKRGVYPLHGFKLGLYRLPITLEDPDEIKSVHDGMKKAFEMDAYADRIFATYRWKEQNMDDPDAKGYEEVELSVTVEIVTGEVVDIIYQIFPIEKFGDPQWVKDYRKKADHFAKMIIDTILRNTILADKMIDSIIKDEKISELNAIIKLEEMTPLAKIVLDAKPKPKPVEELAGDEGGPAIPELDGPKSGPIDVEFKSKMRATAAFSASGYSIKTWGRRGADNKQLGVWGEFVSVDYDICIADGACIEACPVGVYEWFNTPGNVASEKKPLMSKEPDCIFCLACEGVCPPSAIKIFEQK